MRFFSAFPCALQKSDDLMRFESVLSVTHSSAVYRAFPRRVISALFARFHVQLSSVRFPSGLHAILMRTL